MCFAGKKIENFVRKLFLVRPSQEIFNNSVIKFFNKLPPIWENFAKTPTKETSFQAEKTDRQCDWIFRPFLRFSNSSHHFQNAVSVAVMAPRLRPEKKIPIFFVVLILCSVSMAGSRGNVGRSPKVPLPAEQVSIWSLLRHWRSGQWSYRARTAFNQGILKGEVPLYNWPPVWLVWISLFCK
jgi:hypothetical protein